MTNTPRQTAHVFTARPTLAGGYEYLLYLPPAYADEPERRWPLLLFLHGAGERGSHVWDIARHGLPRELEAGRELPGIAVSPQCPEDAVWSVPLLAALLDDVESRYRVDPERVYMTGLSLGGFATWGLALAQPGRFAAIAPVCGGGDPRGVSAIRHLPVWAFHGARDDVVPLRRSEEMVAALRATGGDVRFTVYPEAEHDSWTETYANPALYEWLFSHRRVAPPGEAVQQRTSEPG